MSNSQPYQLTESADRFLAATNEVSINSTLCYFICSLIDLFIFVLPASVPINLWNRTNQLLLDSLLQEIAEETSAQLIFWNENVDNMQFICSPLKYKLKNKLRENLILNLKMQNAVKIF